MTELDLLRIKINKIDTKLVELFKERLEVSREIGKFKKENNLPIFDEKREREIVKFFTSNEITDNKVFIEKFLHLLMDISKEVQAKWESVF